MATLSAIRDGIKTRLDTISGLHAYDTMPEPVITPAAIVRPIKGDYYSALTKVPSYSFEILLLVQLARLTVAQDALDAYLADSGANSIVTAIEGDRTLGATVDDCLIMGWRDYGGITIAGSEYLGVRFDLEVYL